MPYPSVADWVQLDYYHYELEEFADHYRVEVGHPEVGDDDDWERKLEVVADVHPELVSFTFGVPSPFRHRVGLARWECSAMVTVTSASNQAWPSPPVPTAWWCRARMPAATVGCLRRIWTPAPNLLHALIAKIRKAHNVPIIAAGILGTVEDVSAALDRGAVAAQIGTALLLSDEAGTHPAHRTAMEQSAVRQDHRHACALAFAMHAVWRTSSSAFSMTWLRWVIRRCTP